MIIPGLLHAQKQGKLLVDSLLSDLASSGKDTNRINTLYHLSYTFATINPDKGLDYGRQGLKLSRQLGWERGVAKTTACIGINYKAKADYPKALEYLQRALTISERLADSPGIAGKLSNISIVYLSQSNYPQTLEYAMRALKIYEDMGDERSAATVMENIGTVYFEQKNYEKALEHYAHALPIHRKLGNQKGVARCVGNMALVLDATGRYAEALERHREALEVNRDLGDLSSVQINLANIGYVYSHLKDYGKALEYQFKALAISEQMGNRMGIAIDMGNIGETYFAMATDKKGPESLGGLHVGDISSLRESIRYLEKAVAICREIRFSGPLIEFSKYLSDAYLLSGDHRRAFESYKEHVAVKDSVFSIQNQEHIANLEASRELERKDRELLIKDDQIRINELKIAQKRNERIIYLISIVLLLLVIGIVFRTLNNYRKSNRRLLKERQHQVELIDEQIKSLKAHARTLEEISYMQAHDVRGPVATILGLVQNFNFNDPTDPDNKIIIEGIAAIVGKLDVAVQEVIKKDKVV